MHAVHASREDLVQDLLGRAAPAAPEPLRPIFASLLAGRALGKGVLSARLGLDDADFQVLWTDYFPGTRLVLQDGPSQDIAELDDLYHLLLEYRAHRVQSEVWLARILAYACCGRDHLWQDLGLAQRGELSTLMNTAFPALAQLNSADMKWKKFIYRHYCTREGIYVCPAPSCGACADYGKCFAPED